MRPLEIDFKITVPHAPTASDRHDWFFPNGWRGVGPVEQRDRGGKLRGKRTGYLPDWFVLMCNNPDCPGRAVVPVQVLTDHADLRDPEVRP
jgi:hypothetical protein